MVEACISAYSQTAAMCPGDHWRKLENGGRERIINSPLSRIVQKPNDYQSMSDFMLNAVRSLYSTGEAFAVAIRDERFNILEMHLMQSRMCGFIVAQDGSIFYHLSGNEIVERRFGAQMIVPARDVLHIRLHTPRHPLKGETPLMAAALDVAASSVMLQQQIAFFSNQAKPSFVLTTDEKLTADQAKDLRQRWDEQTKGEGAGGTPILSWGIKPSSIGGSAQDAQLAETMKMSDQNVALAFRVPLQILGIGGTPFASTEMLMQSWVASGLGFCLNHVEEAFGKLFGLKGMPDEYLEFDTSALMRSAFKDLIEALGKATISGIYSPDEARGRVNLPKVPGGFGAIPRVQQQVVPLDWEPPAPAAPQPPAAEPDLPDDTSKAIAAARLAQLLNEPAAGTA